MATTAVLCVVCSFIIQDCYLVFYWLNVMVTVTGREREAIIPPVNEDIPLEKTPAIELKTNDAYGPISKWSLLYTSHLFLWQLPGSGGRDYCHILSPF